MKDLVEIPENIKNHLNIHPVKWIDQVLELALETTPKPLEEKAVETAPLVNENTLKTSTPITH
jgi:ATP-dependent Lon protease